MTTSIEKITFRTRLLLAAAAVAGAAGWSALRWLEGREAQLPDCFFHSLTGLYCAGCGLTRAAILAARGHWWAALRMNPLAGVLAVLLLIWTAVWASRRLRGRPVPALSPRVAWAAIVVIAGFAVLRNLPFLPFRWLAPTALP